MGMQQDFVKSYLDAWNQHDCQGVMEHLSPGGLYCDMPRQQELTGEALIQHLNEYFDDDAFRYELVGEVLINANTIAFEYRVCPLESCAENDGWGGAEFIRLCGTAAEHISDYYRLPTGNPGAKSTSDIHRRYAKSGLSAEAMRGLLAALDYLMVDKKIYLDPELSLPRLAEHLECSVNHVSQAINAGHSMSFFDYVNLYRVREATEMLSDKDTRSSAILTIALAVGFNSTSTFYTAFKKATGETPARYRRALS